MPRSWKDMRDHSQDSRMRRKIGRNASMLIDKLVGHVKGTYKMDATQVKAALGLLAKSVPDLQSVELQASGDGPLIIITGIDRPNLTHKTAKLLEQHKTIEEQHNGSNYVIEHDAYGLHGETEHKGKGQGGAGQNGSASPNASPLNPQAVDLTLALTPEEARALRGIPPKW